MNPEFADDRAHIVNKTEHGYAQAVRGQLIDGDEAFQELRRRHLHRRTTDGAVPSNPERKSNY